MRTLAVAMPAYNEADGIGEFLAELDAELARHVERHLFVVVDDASTDDTAAVVEAVGAALVGDVVIERVRANAGHGPTVSRAYRRALGTDPDLVLQVDGDGQFEAADVELLLRGLDAGAAVVTGRRVDRADGLLRKAVSAFLRLALRVRFGVARRDANCPFRLYEAATLERLLRPIPEDSVIPNVWLTVVESSAGIDHREVDVRHRQRRGDDPRGSTWRTSRRGIHVPWRLFALCGRAMGEILRNRPGRRRA